MGSPPQRKLERVLVVDDVPIHREIIVTLLEGLIHIVDEAEDGLAALAAFKRHRYDAILLDIEMPGMDGYAVSRQIRTLEADHGLPRTAIIAITSSDFPGDSQRILDAGADTYLAKPISRQNLIAALRLEQTAEPISPALAHIAHFLPELFAHTKSVLEQVSSSGDMQDIAKQLHDLRGSFAFYGMKDFAEQLRKVETMARSGEVPAPDIYVRLFQELDQLKSQAQDSSSS